MAAHMKYLWIVFVVIAACAITGVVGFWLRKSGKYERVPDFKVVERSGNSLSRRDLMGDVWVVDFVFARCPTACPAMNSAIFDLRRKIPELKILTLSVDPEHDTPKYLAEWVKTMGLEQPGWFWGSGVSEGEMQEIARGFLQGAGRMDGKIVHSERFVLLDRYARIRGAFPVLDPGTFLRDPDAPSRIEAEARKVLAEPAIPVLKLPGVNAWLNGAAGFWLIVGLLFIKAKKPGAHKACMLAALAASAAFLVSYLTAHHFLGSTPYQGQGTMRTVYFSILISHTILAALVVPLALVTVYRAFREDFARHRLIAVWTFPIWLYVSVTGVVIYFMLY